MTEPALIRDDPPAEHFTFAELLARPAWHAKALCHGRTSTFFDVPPGMSTRAHLLHVRAQFCDRCPVTDPCADAGFGEFGIWGGGR